MGRAEQEAKLDWVGKKVALLGVAFKQETNDIRNSPSIDIVNQLVEKRVKNIAVYDPTALPMFQTLFPSSKQISYVDNEKDCLDGVDVVILATDWPQFRSIADQILTISGKKPIIMDGRRLLQHRYDDLMSAGFTIIAVGSPFMKGKS